MNHLGDEEQLLVLRSGAGVGHKLVGVNVQVPSEMGPEASCGLLGCFGLLYKRYSTLVMIVGYQ